MSLTFLLAALALAPAIAAVLVLAAGLARRPLLPVVLAIAALGALLPIGGLVLLLTDVGYDTPLRTTLLGQDALALVLRADGLGLYAALGVAVLVVPILYWVHWRTSPAVAFISGTPAAIEDEDLDDDEDDEDIEDAEDTEDVEDVEVVEEAEELETDTDADTDTDTQPGGWGILVSQGRWVGTAALLALESALLFVCFTDNIIWLALFWILAVAFGWALGELGSDSATLDWVGLGFMAIGPLLWILAMIFLMSAAGAQTLYDLTGHGIVSVPEVLLLAVAFAAAGGAYPFLSWLRRRAAFATPVGVGAIILAIIPIALLIGARTYAALASSNALWPTFGAMTPPITAGIAFSLLGAITVLIVGVLALGRRDVRGLLALLAAAQVGWGLLALGSGQTPSVAALVLLFATSVLGLGAMLASAVAGGMLATDEEPDGAGPRPFDEPLRLLPLVTWIIGAATLIGVPLFGGFAVREMLTAGILNGAKVAIPLVGFAWAGDVLLAIALVRATAPAFAYTDADVKLAEAREQFSRGDAMREELPALPGGILALLAIFLGIAPQGLFALGADLAANQLLPTGYFAREVSQTATGFTLTPGQWLPAIVWVAAAIFAVIFGLLRLLRPATPPVELDEEEDEEIEDEEVVAVDEADEEGEEEGELVEVEEEDEEIEYTPVVGVLDEGLAEPDAAWDQLVPAFSSEWLQPGLSFLLGGIDDENQDEADLADEPTTVEVSPKGKPGAKPGDAAPASPNGTSSKNGKIDQASQGTTGKKPSGRKEGK